MSFASRVIKERSGVSAIEFALLAPVLAFCLIGTVDVGQAVTEHMAIGSVLRMGAQTAIAGGNEAAVKEVMDLAAAKTSLRTGEAGDLHVGAVLICACPESPKAPAACSTTCAGSAPTARYYTITGQKTFTGIFLSQYNLSRELQVQVR